HPHILRMHTYQEKQRPTCSTQTHKLNYTQLEAKVPKPSLYQGMTYYDPGVKSSLLFVFVRLTAKSSFCIFKEFLNKKINLYTVLNTQLNKL
ncbi:unnamed protein product, partial [Rangifer tarandus platyrhynchus]